MEPTEPTEQMESMEPVQISEPIHIAADLGDVAAIERLVAEDGRRLKAQVQGPYFEDEGYPNVVGMTTLMLAARSEHESAVARLLALGADVGLTDAKRASAIHCTWKASILAMLLDAGGINQRAHTRGIHATYLGFDARTGRLRRSAACPRR